MTGMLYKPHPPAGAGKDIVPNPAPAVNGQNSAKIAPILRFCTRTTVYSAKTEEKARGVKFQKRKEQSEQMSERLEEISLSIFRAQQLISFLHSGMTDSPDADALDAITCAARLLLDQALNALDEEIHESMISTRKDKTT